MTGTIEKKNSGFRWFNSMNSTTVSPTHIGRYVSVSKYHK